MPFYHFVVFEWKAPIDSDQLTLTITITLLGTTEVEYLVLLVLGPFVEPLEILGLPSLNGLVAPTITMQKTNVSW